MCIEYSEEMCMQTFPLAILHSLADFVKESTAAAVPTRIKRQCVMPMYALH